MKSFKRSRGVTLIEAMIYVAISAALIAVAMAGVTYATRNNQRQSVQLSQLTALKELYVATARYTSTRLTTLSDTTAEIPIQTLLDSGALRPGWEGAYATAAGFTPLGQRYTVLINRHADSKGVGITVTETGIPLASRMTRWDIQGIDGLRSWKSTLAQSYRKRYGEEVWLLDPPATVGGAPQVRPLSLGGVGLESVTASQDQLPLPITITQAAIAISSRWSDAVRDTSSAAVTTVSNPETCEIVAAPAGVASCPTGKKQITLLPDNNCRYAEARSLANTQAGIVTMATEEFVTGADAIKCGRSCNATTVPGCDAGNSGSGIAVQAVDSSWSCPLVRYTSDLNTSYNLQPSSGAAGWFRVESNGGFQKQYFDRVLVDVFRLEGKEVGRQVCLEDRWTTPVSGTVPNLTAGTLGRAATLGAPPMTRALCCVAN